MARGSTGNAASAESLGREAQAEISTYLPIMAMALERTGRSQSMTIKIEMKTAGRVDAEPETVLTAGYAGKGRQIKFRSRIDDGQLSLLAQLVEAPGE